MLQYLNTGLLTLICGFSVMAAATLSDVRNRQEEVGKELVRMKTVQDQNVENVKEISSRVYTIELDGDENIKSWVDQNYLRKPQH